MQNETLQWLLLEIGETMKKNLIKALVLSIASASCLQAHMHHLEHPGQEWKEENISSFDELFVSWNASRPLEGGYTFYVSVYVGEWSPWLPYAKWGSFGQAGFSEGVQSALVKVDQDAVAILDGKKATGFRVKIDIEDNASLDAIRSLHVYTNSSPAAGSTEFASSFSKVSLPVSGISQIALPDERARRLCSPTSTVAIVRYLSGNSSIEPIAFAERVWDSCFDIFGNWILNVAEAANMLGPDWSCWVERLSGFDAIHERLILGTSVVVSIRGPLPGSAMPYTSGHLIAVIGYDPEIQKVLCMDPAFPSDQETSVSYDLADFLQAWERRGKVAYVFSKKL